MNYLCPGQRYKLSWIHKIDNEDIVLRTPHVFTEITFFTKSYKKEKLTTEKKDIKLTIINIQFKVYKVINVYFKRAKNCEV